MDPVKHSLARQRFAAIDLTRDTLTLLLPTQESGGGEPSVRQRQIVWRREATDLLSPIGREELTAAFVTLASEAKLQGVQLYLTLSSDFCVTRVVSGENEVVRREVQELIQRSRGYLSLGVGEKVAAVSEEAIDARRRFAWVTVANKQVLQTIDLAATSARLHLKRIEHSVVSVSRAVQLAGVDTDSPVILIDLADNGVDVAICYRGQLLLDYRPSGTRAKESVGVIVSRHTKRLQRYVDRLLRNGSNPFRGLCLCGKPEDVAAVREQLAQVETEGFTEPHVLIPGNVSAGWELDDVITSDSRLSGPFGLLLHVASETRGDRYPNLIDSLRGSRRLPLGKTLLRVGWPIALTIAASLLLSVINVFRYREVSHLEARIDSLAPEVAEVARLEHEALSARRKTTHLETLSAHSGAPEWSRLMVNVGRSQPRGVWMSQFKVDGAGVVVISGTSYSEEGVFEFVDHLKHVPGLWSVALEGTQATYLETGPAVSFTLRGGISDQISVSEEGLPVSAWTPAPDRGQAESQVARKRPEFEAGQQLR